MRNCEAAAWRDGGIGPPILLNVRERSTSSGQRVGPSGRSSRPLRALPDAWMTWMFGRVSKHAGKAVEVAVVAALMKTAPDKETHPGQPAERPSRITFRRFVAPNISPAGSALERQFCVAMNGFRRGEAENYQPATHPAERLKLSSNSLTKGSNRGAASAWNDFTLFRPDL